MSDADRVVRVTILGTTYTVVSDRDEQYVRDLARYLDDKLAKFMLGRNLPVLQRVILTALNVADELVRERERRDELLAQIGNRTDRLIASLDEDGDPPPLVLAGTLEEG